MAGEEAIMFVVDANHTMNVPYGSNAPKLDDVTSKTTRLTAVKDAVLQKIASLAWQSKQHEFGLVILKTKYTHHHLHSTSICNISQLFSSDKSIKHEDEDAPFPNQIELDLTRPNISMLNTINSIRVSDSKIQTPECDFCQSLILAADTLYRRTNGKKYKRSIVLFTDAEHEVDVDGERLECVLKGLKRMDVELEVVGFGFVEEGVFVKEEDAMEKFEDGDVKSENGCGDGHDMVDSSEDDDESDAKMPAKENDAVLEDSQDLRMLIKRENEKFLVSLTQQIGGCVLAANGQDITSLLENYHAKRSPDSSGAGRAVRSTCEFKITPNLTIQARYSKLISQTSLPSLKKDAYVLDETTGEPIVDGGGEFMTTPVDTIIYHTLLVNEDNPEEGTINVPQESRTDAYRFGSDLIPLGKMDMAGINATFKSPKCIEMIGYIPSKDVHQSGLTLGPTYALYGGKESNRSMTTVAALAESMERNKLWGYCRFVKSQNGDPKIGVLVPQQAENNTSSPEGAPSNAWYFKLLSLPFSDDVNYLKPPQVPLDHWGNDKECKASDDLIDALMLDDNELDSKTITCPALRSFQRMITHLAMNPVSDKERKEGLSEERILEAASPAPLSELDVVKMLSVQASRQIESFFEAFPLCKNVEESKKNERKYWGDGNT